MPSRLVRDNRHLIQLAILALAAMALVYVALALIGAVRSYTPVPLTDMWDGTVDFYRRTTEGDLGIWIAGHNEHRIVLARMLFWLDMSLFGGTAWFLIAVNYLLMAMAAAVCACLLKAAIPSKEHLNFRIGTTLFLFAWLFSWCQEGNLTWGFQSQFILAQLLPLAALLAMYHAGNESTSSRKWFVAAVALGIASLGTMANGVLALPVLAFYALATRQGWRRVAVLSALALSLGAAYQYGLTASSGPSKLELLRNNPSEFLRFLLLYLGSPFYYITRDLTPHAREVAAAMGAVLIAGSIIATLCELRQVRPRRIEWALVMFLVYIGGTAAGTTLGRASSGEIQALASRYTTPAIMGWAVLVIWLASTLASRGRRWQLGALLVMIGTLALGSLEQRHAAADQNDKHFEQSLAAVAMGMQVADEDQISTIYPFLQNAISLARSASDAHLSIFRTAPWNVAPSIIGTAAPPLPAASCQGTIDETGQASQDTRYLRIRGWLHGPVPGAEGSGLRVLANNQVVGYGLIGKSRPDVAAQFGTDAVHSGFVAYVLREQASQPLTLLGAGCKLATLAPPLVFVESGEPPMQGEALVQRSAVLPDNAWLGKDFHQSTFPDLQVMASLVRGDTDTGEVKFTAGRGAYFFYRSGPTAGRQRILIDDGKSGSAILPLAESNWVRLTLDAPSLPETFTVTLSDEGDAWGEWSAIAVGGVPERAGAP
ncbi:hypothetical protein EN794_020785 [Mesorhizobium sp. M00.F.Ca.ET.151.01.1.1]|uniref:hypothetical protein n=2 Tax=Pseudomonadota TaxID=1224 RepID=UPI0011397478|nr:hypothetical protein EN842_17330 [bacterium M00.F.Ca.ET.199.01.1.1]TGT06186.1 hypothetical protein EN820_09045 [bacterium M00.F.Ca.ET.177.01.1.1]TGT61808.1 hypothetical protein EN813_016020 [Mesorhizobium sp. M00.F.Ca.ET.170.01.1.1]TGU13411.1 hypothetical protein EN806_12515 [bacterium M00.F.Ca.ET.163.01.1.1]TGU95371.1 hypothetical protein EN794_020785 [Mesorhizobium sp. M00.F.Ca.ET.151.01.1.1]TGV57126.1 hypothetical protein EN784_21585 [bacterium M00.F.Ca.ET.141.01.1.1]